MLLAAPQLNQWVRATGGRNTGAAGCERAPCGPDQLSPLTGLSRGGVQLMVVNRLFGARAVPGQSPVGRVVIGLLKVEQPVAPNVNLGQVLFGCEGFLSVISASRAPSSPVCAMM